MLISSEGEPLIIEYKTQQYKLFPHIASSFAMNFASRWIWEMYNNVTSELEQGDLERLPEVIYIYDSMNNMFFNLCNKLNRMFPIQIKGVNEYECFLV